MASDNPKQGLSLINTLPEVQPRNYWNTSGKNLEYFPTEPRANSTPTLNKQGRVIQEPKDDWWINSKKHQYCFWTYLRDKSQPDGTMEPLLQSEISELFGCSSTKIHFMLREAMGRLTIPENMEILQNLFDLTEDDPGEDNIAYRIDSQLNQVEEDEDT